MHEVPFKGVPPQVRDGDPVEVRTATGEWVRTTAKSEVRYDTANAIGNRCWLTVAVVLPDLSIVNWPAEDVRAVRS